MSAATTVPSLARGLVNQPIAQIDLARYAGHWHEIAHLPMYFQRQCIDHVTADYTLRTDGKLDVRNVCRTRRDVADVAEGLARPGKSGAGSLEVRFAPAWLAWVPFVWADYWVIDLDPDYGWAVVGSPSRKYLWILSRTPRMEKSLFDELCDRAVLRGYTVDKLVMTGRVS
ncbi:lipocalin family protein [Dyella amyloliquefaciens]|uniref:lipocalin family protein n=1 Tax=Dyella amyloliquefaciens TaxID=1770545 RepID=UPI00102EAFA0|nr:lipocalin family protein [Dyella amyloliquefaciens]